MVDVDVSGGDPDWVELEVEVSGRVVEVVEVSGLEIDASGLEVDRLGLEVDRSPPLGAGAGAAGRLGAG